MSRLRSPQLLSSTASQATTPSRLPWLSLRSKIGEANGGRHDCDPEDLGVGVEVGHAPELNEVGIGVTKGAETGGDDKERALAHILRPNCWSRTQIRPGTQDCPTAWAAGVPCESCQGRMAHLGRVRADWGLAAHGAVEIGEDSKVEEERTQGLHQGGCAAGVLAGQYTAMSGLAGLIAHRVLRSESIVSRP